MNEYALEVCRKCVREGGFGGTYSYDTSDAFDRNTDVKLVMTYKGFFVGEETGYNTSNVVIL